MPRKSSWPAAAVLVLAIPVRAGVLAVPLAPLPAVDWQESRSPREWRITGGFLSVAAPGMQLSGGAAGWEFAHDLRSGRRIDIHAEGVILSGRADPRGPGGKIGAHLGGGSIGASLSAPVSAGLRVRAGVELFLQSMTLDPIPAGTPNDTFALFFGLPLSAELTRALGADWTFTPAARAAVYGAGSELEISPTASRHVDPFFSGGASFGLAYVPWRLSLEAGFEQTSGSGNNRPAAVTRAQLAWRW